MPNTKDYDFMNPAVGIKEANKNDVYPHDIKASNALYAKYWKQGFFAITGQQPQDLSGAATLLDPYILLMAQMIKNTVAIGKGKLPSTMQGHVGGPDFANPLYWATGLLIPANIELFFHAKNEDHNWGQRIAAGAGGALLTPVTAVISLVTLLTTYLWLLAKATVGAVGMTLSSPIWYSAKLAKLKADDSNLYYGEVGVDYDKYENQYGGEASISL